MAESLAGQLLLASPSLQDPNFVRTVVLVGVHSEEGAMGIVLNRPSALTVGEAVPQLERVGGGARAGVRRRARAADVDRVPRRVRRPRPRRAARASGRIGFPSPEAGVEELADRRPAGRACSPATPAGAAASSTPRWRDGDWIAQTALPEDVFTDAPEELWGRVLERKGGSYALLARMPLDPSVN